MQELLNWDYKIFKYVHCIAHNRFLDFILPFIRNPFFWGPLYLFLAVFMYENFKQKGMQWVLFFLITFGMGDFFSARIIKPILHRTRPCNDAMWYGLHRHLVPDSSGYSFPSSHATNHFALAIFIWITCGKFHGSIKYLCITWAAMVAYAQVYVGVHYPIDVICGTLLGIWIGYITGNYFKMKYQL